jgi:hypothetical protein
MFGTVECSRTPRFLSSGGRGVRLCVFGNWRFAIRSCRHFVEELFESSLGKYPGKRINVRGRQSARRHKARLLPVVVRHDARVVLSRFS